MQTEEHLQTSGKKSLQLLWYQQKALKLIIISTILFHSVKMIEMESSCNDDC